MTTIAHEPVSLAWEDAGRRAASSLDAASSALVVADEPLAAAHVALGIAQVHAERRRVALADLIGDAAPLQALVTTDDPHGVTDSFEYGVSLNKIARQVDSAGHLFVLPSGSEPVFTEEMLRSERWRLLAESFQRAGALLLLVAPASAGGVDALARLVDGVVIVGEVPPRLFGDVRVLANVPAPRPAPPGDAATRAAPRAPRVAGAEPRRRRPVVPIVGALVAAGVAGWLFLGRDGNAPAATPVAPARTVAPSPADTASAAPPPAAAASQAAAGGGLLVVNPGDSARAARFSVLVSTFPNAAGARLRVRQDTPQVPAATVAAVPVPRGGERHQYVAGAYATRAEADSLLRVLRRRAAVGARGGSVIDRPLAFLLREGLTPDSAHTLAEQYRRQGVAVYGLRQDDGTVRIFAGAFDTAAQAGPLQRALRTAGVEPTLAYRTGRPL